MPNDHQTCLWQIAATPGALTSLLNAMTGLPAAYQSTQSQEEFATWLRIQLGQSASLGKIFPHQVYVDVISKITGYNYGKARIDKDYKAPRQAKVTGNTITCAEQTGETVTLWKWDFVEFTEVSITGVVANGVVTFSNVPAGIYVLASNNTNRLPGEFLTVS